MLTAITTIGVAHQVRKYDLLINFITCQKADGATAPVSQEVLVNYMEQNNLFPFTTQVTQWANETRTHVAQRLNHAWAYVAERMPTFPNPFGARGNVNIEERDAAEARTLLQN